MGKLQKIDSLMEDHPQAAYDSLCLIWQGGWTWQLAGGVHVLSPVDGKGSEQTLPYHAF